MDVAVACPGDLLRRAAADHGDRVAFVADDATVTWAELEARVSAAAAALVAAGLTPGDRVVLVRPTSVALVVEHLAALRAGLVSCPVNPALTAPELTHVLTDSGARAVVGPTTPAGLPEGVEVLDLTGPPAADDPHLDRTGEDLAVLLYTSGTSGRPRGAMLSARAMVANVAQVAAIEPALVTPDDVVLLPLPLFHVFGLGAALGVVLWNATTTVLAAHFDPVACAAAVAAHGVTVVVGAPPMYAAWSARVPVREAFAGVRLALSGASALPAALVREYASDGVALFEGYGMTETAPVLTCNAIGARPGVRADPTPGSIGRPLPGIEVRLLDVGGDEVDDGDPGQLTVRGDNLFSGYWPDGRDGPVDGWFATGDIAVRDDDGNLWLVGRTTDLVIVNGFNVYPAEVESVIGQLPGVAEVAVVGVPDDRTGEAVVAYVVGLPDATPDAEAVREAARSSLARYKVPARVEIVGSLPHTVTGKVQKWRLADAAVPAS
ncbi:AMP-binding protein [Jatrophihabitans sp. YIM 134969]